MTIHLRKKLAGAKEKFLQDVKVEEVPQLMRVLLQHQKLHYRQACHQWNGNIFKIL